MEIEFHNRPQTRVFHIGVSQDWLEWFCAGYNWRNFTFIQLALEVDHFLGGFDVDVGFMGFRLWFTTYDCGPGSIIEEVERMADSHPWEEK